jgi:flavin-binding protein dodecin
VTAAARLAALQAALRRAAKGYRNLVEFEVIPSSFFAEALAQAELLEYEAAFDVDQLVDEVRGEISEAIEEEFERNYEGEDVRQVIRRAAVSRGRLVEGVLAETRRLTTSQMAARVVRPAGVGQKKELPKR